MINRRVQQLRMRRHHRRRNARRHPPPRIGNVTEPRHRRQTKPIETGQRIVRKPLVAAIGHWPVPRAGPRSGGPPSDSQLVIIVATVHKQAFDPSNFATTPPVTGHSTTTAPLLNRACAIGESGRLRVPDANKPAHCLPTKRDEVTAQPSTRDNVRQSVRRRLTIPTGTFSEAENLTLPADLIADLADAETAVRSLNDGAGAGTLALEGLARFLLRAESVASSKIEGLEAGARRLLEAEIVLGEGGNGADRIAVEVLGNIAAMDAAIDLGSDAPEIRVNDLLDIHRRLMERTPLSPIGGIVRTTQNWIGGSSFNPCSAAFVPPPADNVDELLADLVDYVDGDDHPPLVQAAIAHAQFETIHPFADGNGRTGRSVIHIVLRRRGLAPRVVPPVSLVFATRTNDYIAGLSAFRYAGPSDSPDRSTAAHTWLRTFATAMTRACADAQSYTARIGEIEQRWRRELGRVRADSAVALLLDCLPGAPIVTVDSATKLINRSPARAGDAINQLVNAGVLRQRNAGRQRYRIFEATDIIELFTGLERALASPTGNTASRKDWPAIAKDLKLF
jgi:Fic family protein